MAQGDYELNGKIYNSLGEEVGSGTVGSGGQYSMNGVTYNAAGDVVDGNPLNSSAPAQNTGPTAEQIAAQKAAALRSGIGGLISSITGVYDLLHGDIGAATQEQQDLLQQRYNKETGALTDQFNQELPAIGRGYAGRGIYDSSYRINAEDAAGKGFQNQIRGIGDQLTADRGKLGQALAVSQADIANQKGGLQALLNQANGITDVNELTQLRDTLDQKLRAVTADRAGNQTRSSYIAQLNKAAPVTDRTGELKAVLTNIIQGQAPRALKIQTAQEIIGSSGLSEEEKNRVTQEFTSAV